MKRAEELNWFPDYMKVRLEHWIEGLKYDWNISRQRFYGVPFPLWYVEETGDVILAEESDLPIDPIEDSPPKWAQEKYKGMTIKPETDVMETWMTSSLTPLINANWAGREGRKSSMDIYPMTLRVQAFEIIRTWLFYTMAKSEFHTDSLPWENVMISGWGLNEQGKKISKRDLEKFTDENGYNRYDPYSLIQKFGADALRYWAASSQLGRDLRFHEREVKDGRKVVVKLWNVARMAFMYIDEFDPKNDSVPISERPVEDQWIVSELDALTKKMTDCFEKYDYATAKEAIHKFFWMTYCDDYLELVKTRFWENTMWSEKDKLSAKTTLFETLRKILGLFAPFLPYVTEEIYQQAGKFGETTESLHVSEWPEYTGTEFGLKDDMKIILETLYTVRKLRTERQIGQGARLDSLTFEVSDADLKARVSNLEKSLTAAARAEKMNFTASGTKTSIDGLAVDIVPQKEDQEKTA